MAETLPKFRNPPVVETVLGLQFEPIRGLSNAHLGAYWESVDDAWPTVRDAPYLPPQHEQFDGYTDLRQRLRLQLTSSPASRILLHSGSGDRMMQVQNGRFHLNWRKTSEQPQYPSFATVLPQFMEHWGSFRRFLDGAGLEAPRVDQWEVTYVNHIPRGDLWETVEQWAQVIPGLLSAASLRAVAPRSGGGLWIFEIPPERGRLYVETQHNVRESPPEELLVLKLTARGPLTEEGDAPAGLNTGHEAIVLTFDDLISEEARAAWGRINSA